MNPSIDKKKWAEVIAKAWIDPAFKKRLLADPTSTLAEHHIHCKKTIKIIEADSQHDYLLLPPKPQGHLSEEQMRRIAAAGEDNCYIM
jgi:hypothetical protein